MAARAALTTAHRAARIADGPSLHRTFATSPALSALTVNNGKTVAGAGAAPQVSSAGTADPDREVEALLNQLDKPSLLAAQFYPPPLQTHYKSIRAFNAEVARVSESVENELMARIRVAWWRDAITSTFNGKAPHHPVILAVANAIHDPLVQQNGGLVLDHFTTMCDAREAELSSNLTPPTLDEVERYAERTSSRLFYLSLNLLGVSRPVIDEIFSHLGKARGIVQLLASVPFHAGVIRTTRTTDTAAPTDQPRASRAQRPPTPRQRRLVLPREFIAAHGVVEEEVYRKGAQASGLRDAVFDTATRANDYAITARTLLKEEFKTKRQIPNALIGPLVEATTVTTFLSELQRRDFDVFDPKLLLVASGRGFRLPWSMFKVGNRWTYL